MFGDGDVLAVRHPFKQFCKMCFSFKGINNGRAHRSYQTDLQLV